MYYLQRSSEGQVKSAPKLADENYEDDEDEQGETLCGSCGGNYSGDEFWICCDICERWFHGKCVKITPAKAENIKQYKCPSCSMKKAGRSHWCWCPMIRECHLGNPHSIANTIYLRGLRFVAKICTVADVCLYRTMIKVFRGVSLYFPVPDDQVYDNTYCISLARWVWLAVCPAIAGRLCLWILSFSL